MVGDPGWLGIGGSLLIKQKSASRIVRTDGTKLNAKLIIRIILAADVLVRN